VEWWYRQLKSVLFGKYREMTEEELAELAESIKERGLIHPLVVRPVEGGYEIISGHQKKRALEKLGRETAPCIVKELTDEEAEIMLLDANIQARPLSVMETARAIRRKKELLANVKDEKNAARGRYNEKLAEEFGFSKAKIARLDKLNDLIQPFQDMVEDGVIGTGAAEQIAHLDRKTQQALYDILGAEIRTIKSKELKKIRKENERGYLVLSVLERRVRELEDELGSLKDTVGEREAVEKEIARLQQKKKELMYDLEETENAVSLTKKRAEKKGAQLVEILERLSRTVRDVQPRVEALLNVLVTSGEIDEVTRNYCLRLAYPLGELERFIESCLGKSDKQQSFIETKK